MTEVCAMAVEIGYALSSEEHGPAGLVENAVRAEASGFSFLAISDHFHPWIRSQGHSPFVWGVIGAIARATGRIRLGTGVTCPTIRTHPGLVAQAAATAACLLPGRFVLGVGTGEALNEHVFGDSWPPAPVRLEMLEEAVAVIRLLWEGGNCNFEGTYYTLVDARIFDLPPEPPPILVAAAGPRAAELAGRIGDGLWNAGGDGDLVAAFEAAGGRGKPRYGQATVCWAPDESQARKIAREAWPNAGLPGQLGQDLPTPVHFEQVTQLVTEDHVAGAVVCGPDPERYLERIGGFVAAGFTHVYLHQVGANQDGFFRFWEGELRPALAAEGLIS
jgi:coenzyme F420-dependent glucose-6-phosphate dehydrogenase